MVGAGWRDPGVIALIGVYVAAVWFVNLFVFPGHGLAILHIVPILLVGAWKPARFVLTVTALVILIEIIGFIVRRPVLPVRLVAVAAVMIVGYFTVIFAERRQESIKQRERQEQVIRAVERMRQPLTVILASAQLVLAGEDLSRTGQQRMSAVVRAARDLKASIEGLLAEGDP